MFENVIEAMVDAVFVVDGTGAISHTNRAARSLTGYLGSELEAAPIGNVLVDDESGLRTAVRTRIERGDVLRRQHAWLVTKLGKRIPVSVTGSPMVTPGGLAGIVLVARDTRQLRDLLAEKEAE